MVRASLIAVLALHASARADDATAPGATPPSREKVEHDECLARRRAIYAEATAQKNVAERGRLLQTMPECKAPAPSPVPDEPAIYDGAYVTPPSSVAPMSATSGPPAPIAPVASPIAVRAVDVPPRKRPSTMTVAAEPVLLILTTASILVERAVAKQPSIGVALLGGFGVTQSLTYGDRVRHSYRGFELDEVTWTRLHAGAQLNVYLDRTFRGPHVGAEVGYKHFSGDGETIAVLTESVYFGWKWIRITGFTAALQGGLSLVEMKDDNATFPGEMGWHLNRDGTLRAVHLHMNIAFGWSF